MAHCLPHQHLPSSKARSPSGQPLLHGSVSARVPMLSHSVLSDSVTPWTIIYQAPLSMEFSRQEYWRRFPFPPPGDLPDPGIEPTSCALAGELFITEPPGKRHPSPSLFGLQSFCVLPLFPQIWRSNGFPLLSVVRCLTIVFYPFSPVCTCINSSFSSFQVNSPEHDICFLSRLTGFSILFTIQFFLYYFKAVLSNILSLKLLSLYLFIFGRAGSSLLSELSLVRGRGGYSLVVVCGLLIEVASSVPEHRV